MDAATARTLLLSSGYEPVKVIPWQRAITLLFLGKVEVLEEYDAELRAVSVVLRAPAVVRLLRAFRRHPRPVKFSRAHLYARDDHACQYCGAQAPPEELTYDHVVPRAQGGRTEWTNIVTCCHPCNRAKGGRTPRQAGMQLARPPARPAWMPAMVIQLSTRAIPEPWRAYLAWGQPGAG
jgi:5-methylcytosine-specific restriction endonuclease McrA